MTRITTPLKILAAGLSLAVAAHAQENPPPWWGVADDVTVSLHWNFDAGFAGFPQPNFAVVPPWYVPAVTNGVATPNIVRIPSLGGHVGVLGMLGNGAPQTGSLDLTVDNDPHYDWIKIFWFQFDVFEGTSGSVVSQLERSLSYDRAIVSETSVPIGNGWERVTVTAQLIPQPTDEGIDWTFVENAFGTVAIDNLYVSSKCVKPGPDETGDALGKVDGAPIDLTNITGSSDCQGVAVTEGQAPTFTRRYWVGTRDGPGQNHRILRIDGSGPAAIVTATVLTGETVLSAPRGIGDLAAETVVTWPSPGNVPVITAQWVYAIVDRRPSGQPPVLYRIDALGGSPLTQIPLFGFPVIAAAPPAQDLGLAFDPSGDQGAGTYWVSFTDNNGVGRMIEYSRGGLPRPIQNAPADCVGLGYDAALGNFYGFSRAPQPTPFGPIEVNGFEWSGYDFQSTGTRFCGDLGVLNGAGPPGGHAAGLEVYRRLSTVPLARSSLSIACVVDAPNATTVPPGRQWLYELSGPFGFGYSVLGRCGMRNGPPFVGGAQFEVTLKGVPNSLFAMMFLGFSNTASAFGPLPVPLGAALGWPESILSISPDISSPLLLPSAPGEFSLPIPIPANPSLAYAPIFFQWLALDTSINGGFALSQAGKTVVYR